MFNKITFIGAGNMAEAMLKGLLLKKIVTKENVLITDILAQRLKYIAETYGVKTCSNNVQALNESKVIVLALKPQVIGSVINELNQVDKDKLIISIVAGVKIATIDASHEFRVARAMPNTPALIGEAATAVAFNEKIKDQDKEFVLKIFSSLGLALEVEERDLNAVTALSGSGPAFVFRLIEAFIEGGQVVGLTEAVAKELAVQTFIGSAKLAAKNDKSLEHLVNQVTSPNGTTAAGREVLEKSEMKKIIIDTVTAAKNRADQLSEDK